MKALVTGSAGFLGRHFSPELKRRGWDVARVDVRDPSFPIDAAQIFSGRIAAGHVFDLIIHCAAVEPHRAAIDGNPMHLAQNLLLDAGLFEWAIRTGQKRVLYISSCAAYPAALQTGGSCAEPLIPLLQSGWSPESVIEAVKQSAMGALSTPATFVMPLASELTITPARTRESAIDLDAPRAPFDSYGWLKLTGEKLAADAARAGLPVHIVRPFSGYGEDQGENWPFGAFAARVRRREDPFVIWGDGTQVRDWIHVSDVISGALAVVEQDVREPVNLCTGIGTSMLELVELFCKTAGYEPDLELDKTKPAGVAYRVGDPSRLRKYYTPQVGIAEGVERALSYVDSPVSGR